MRRIYPHFNRNKCGQTPLVIFSWMMSSVIAFFISFHERFFFVACCMWIGVCLAVSSFCYLKIYAALRRQQAEIQSHQQHLGATLNIAWYRKTVASPKWVCLTLIVCCLPYTVVCCYQYIKKGTSTVWFGGLEHNWIVGFY